MAFDGIYRRLRVTVLWLATALIAAWCAGWCYAMGFSLGSFVLLLASILCAYMTSKGLMRTIKRIKYIINASLNEDFSYKFPTDIPDRYERETNQMLNTIVQHLEKLSASVRKSEAFLSWAINLTDTGIVVADNRGDIIMHNDAALKLLERSAITNIIHIPPKSSSDLLIKKREMVLNEKVYMVYTLSDLRSPVQTAEVESWEKLTRVLTHEIMNSLTPIQSIAENMRGKAATNDMSEAFDSISSSSRSLMSFVRDFRKFNILPHPNMKALYIKPLLEKCVRLASEYAGADKSVTTLQCFPPDMMVYTDEAMMSQVILNIMKNAIEASPSHIDIVACVKSDESTEIKISNDGEIIPENTANQIFTPFFTTKQGGSGIGLSLSRRIINHLGGTLTLKTLPHTCFIIRI